MSARGVVYAAQAESVPPVGEQYSESTDGGSTQGPVVTEGELIASTILISGIVVYVLIDTGCRPSTASSDFVKRGGWTIQTSTRTVRVQTPLEDIEQAERWCRGLRVRVDGRDLQLDALVLDIDRYDVLLGIDWLARHQAVIDCTRRLVQFPRLGGMISLTCRRQGDRLVHISALHAQRLIDAGCEAYLASVQVATMEDTSLADIPIVSEFSDVFPDDLPGLAPHREVEFRIDLLPSIVPISRAPYRMAPAELRELKVQLDELLEKGFIRPSTSPWGAPVLFVKKKMGVCDYALTTGS